jgi:hypothetical protein
MLVIPSLAGTIRGQIDDHAILCALETGVDRGPLDAMGALPNRRLGQPDQLGLRQHRRRTIDLNRQGVDAEQRERCELGGHGSRTHELVAISQHSYTFRAPSFQQLDREL